MSSAPPPRSAEPRAPVAAIVLTLDEERAIEACLASVADLVEELWVVDSGSTDRTVEIARRYTAPERIVVHAFEDYARQRNWALDTLPIQAPWILHLDAGERATRDLAAAIRRRLGGGGAAASAGAVTSAGAAASAAPTASADADGFLVAARTMFLGRWIRHGGRYPVWHLRLHRRGRGRWEPRAYDQHLVVDGRIERLAGDLVDEVASDLTRWSERHLRWARLEAAEQVARRRGPAHRSTGSRATAAAAPDAALDPGPAPERSAGLAPALLGPDPRARRRFLRERLYARAPRFARALAWFAYRYVVQRGFLDGVPGLVYHFLHAAWFRFLVDAMAWEAERLGAMGRTPAAPGPHAEPGAGAEAACSPPRPSVSS